MSYKTIDSRMAAITEQYNKVGTAFQHPDKNKLLYHYTSLEVFWKCIDSNSMYARNVRFSNDTEEYELGKKIVSDFIEKKKLTMSREESYYMICFCQDGDLLSQWRGYAKDGVCIGFDFSYGEFNLDFENRKKVISKFHSFTVLNNNKYREKEKTFLKTIISDEGKIEEQKKYKIQDEIHTVLAAPFCVAYKSETNSIENKLEDIFNNIDDKNQKEYMLCNYIPYIKHGGFEEEKECRILIDLHSIKKCSRRDKEEIWNKKIFYLEKDNGIRLPSIEIMFGNAKEKTEKCQYIIVEEKIYTSDKYKTFFNEFNAKMEREGIHIIKGEKDKSDIIVGDGNNQEDLSIEIEKMMDEYGIKRDGRTVKIWYQGHLPIRNVMVAPSEDMARVKECIEYYKNSIYWLKYIDVLESSIPFRK
ncbi:MAG: DUF2971 domain-containing protein [Eubacterium sp.]